MQETLFEFPKKPRQPHRKLMHVTDAGDYFTGLTGNQHGVEMTCSRCGHVDQYVVENVTEGRRGLPCPKCNPVDA